jgi:uncharacterized protein
MERAAAGRGLNFSLPAVGGFGFSSGTPGSVTIPAPQTINEALDIVRYVAEKRAGKLVVVIDEMERIEDAAERDKFAEFIKNVSTLGNEVRFICCGIASDVNELLNSHPSAGRNDPVGKTSPQRSLANHHYCGEQAWGHCES